MESAASAGGSAGGLVLHERLEEEKMQKGYKEKRKIEAEWNEEERRRKVIEV